MNVVKGANRQSLQSSNGWWLIIRSKKVVKRISIYLAFTNWEFSLFEMWKNLFFKFSPSLKLETVFFFSFFVVVVVMRCFTGNRLVLVKLFLLFTPLVCLYEKLRSSYLVKALDSVTMCCHLPFGKLHLSATFCLRSVARFGYLNQLEAVQTEGPNGKFEIVLLSYLCLQISYW